MADWIPIGGKLYRWDQINDPLSRRELTPLIEREIAHAKADPIWAEKMGYKPEHIRAAIRYTTGEFDGMSPEATNKTVLGSAYTPPLSSQLSGRELAKEVSKLAGSQDYKIALERKRAKREMTTGQQAAFTRMEQLEALTAAEARKERPPLPGKYKAEQPYVSTRIREISKLPPHEQVHAAREYRAELKRHPGFLDEHHPEHKQILAEHHRTYEAETFEDGTPVPPDESE
jgi:hypothetical protein